MTRDRLSKASVKVAEVHIETATVDGQRGTGNFMIIYGIDQKICFQTSLRMA